MRFLRIMVTLGGFAASLYYGVNIGVGAAGTAGGKALLSIVLVVIGLTFTGVVCLIMLVAEHRYRMKHDLEYRLAYAVSEHIYRR